MSNRPNLQDAGQDWPCEIFDVLASYNVRQVAYVPDGGHARLITQVHQSETMRAITLTTEEEGVALSAGAWIGGDRRCC